jgi:hypothetical protein
MKGGVVVEIIDLADKLWVNTVERDKLDENLDRYSSATYVVLDEISRRIRLKDSLWWHGSYAVWTPSKNTRGIGRRGIDFDIQIRRPGFSDVERP